MFKKTGAPEKGVRIHEEGDLEEQVPNGGSEQPNDDSEEEEDAAVEK